jgi:nucleoside-diphosphate kinase
MKERTFVMIKPDGIQRGLIGTLITRLEQGSLKIVAMKLLSVPRHIAEKHYGIHKKKKFYENLLEYITSGPVLAMVWEGDRVIERVRKIVGATDPFDARPGTIRGDFAQQIGRNLIHASDSLENAKNEISLWFTDQEISSYEKIDESWIYEK